MSLNISENDKNTAKYDDKQKSQPSWTGGHHSHPSDRRDIIMRN